MYNQELQANLVQFPGSILYNGVPPTTTTSQTSNNYYATLAPTDTSAYSTASTMSPAALIEMANNVQQHAAELQAQENQMMTQFQGVMSLWETANSIQNSATSNNKSKEHKQSKNKNNNNKISPQPRKYWWTY